MPVNILERRQARASVRRDLETVLKHPMWMFFICHKKTHPKLGADDEWHEGILYVFTDIRHTLRRDYFICLRVIDMDTLPFDTLEGFGRDAFFHIKISRHIRSFIQTCTKLERGVVHKCLAISPLADIRACWRIDHPKYWVRRLFFAIVLRGLGRKLPCNLCPLRIVMPQGAFIGLTRVYRIATGSVYLPLREAKWRVRFAAVRSLRKISTNLTIAI